MKPIPKNILPRIGLLWATVGASMPLQPPRRMMDQGNLAEESHPVDGSLATAEESNMGQGNLPEEVGLVSTVEGSDMVQKYKEKLREIYRLKDFLRTARVVVDSRVENFVERRFLRGRALEAALRRKRRELDNLLHQGTQQYYSAAFAGPERVKDAILTTAMAEPWRPDVAAVVAQMVPAPDRQHAAYGQLAGAYLDHLLAHERQAPERDDPYRAYLEGKRNRLQAVSTLSVRKMIFKFRCRLFKLN